MDAVEKWLVDQATEVVGDTNMPRTQFDICMALASKWHDDSPIEVVVAADPLAEFLARVEGPTMIGLDPVVYPACVRCSQAWKLTRSKGVWAWSPDCNHKSVTCKLVHA